MKTAEEYLAENFIGTFAFGLEYRTKKSAILRSLQDWRFTMCGNKIYQHGKCSMEFVD